MQRDGSWQSLSACRTYIESELHVEGDRRAKSHTVASNSGLDGSYGDDGSCVTMVEPRCKQREQFAGIGQGDIMEDATEGLAPQSA